MVRSRKNRMTEMIRFMLCASWSLRPLLHCRTQNSEVKMPLDQYLPDHFSRHIREPELPAVVQVSKPRMIDAQLVENRRVQVVHGNLVLDGLMADLVSSAITHASLDAA